MKSLFPAVVLVLLVLGVMTVVALKRISSGNDGTGAGNDTWPFYAKKSLSAAEQVLFHRLVKALPGHIVLAQVQLSRVLGVKKGFNFHE